MDTAKNSNLPHRYLRLPATADKTGMGGSTILAWEALGKFPRAVRLAPNLRVWLESDIDDWILAQHAKRNSPPRLSGADKTDGEGGRKPSKAVDRSKKRSRHRVQRRGQ